MLIAVASLLEIPSGRGFGSVQLNLLIRLGSLGAAVVALVLAHGL